MKFINDYPYTNMTAQNIDWLIKAVVDLIHQGKTDEEIKNAPGISEAYGAFCNAYPYTNMTMQNIDWLISSVRELYDKEATLEETITKIEAQIATLQADVDNVVNKFGDKVDKLNVKNNVYVTDGSTPPKTTGIQYLESPLEGTIPIRDGIGSLQVPTAQDATQAVNKGQMDTALDGKLDKTTKSAIIYGTDTDGNQHLYKQESNYFVPWSIPIRNSNGGVVTYDAVLNFEAVNLRQMNKALDKKVDKTTALQAVYAHDSAGKDIALRYDYEATAGVAVRSQNGVLKVGAPVANNDATTKEYVDNAIATTGWVTIIDKTWTEDETNDIISILIPAEYQKAMSELRMTYYNNTPEAGAVYSAQNVDIRLYDGEQTLSFMYTGNILPTKDKKDVNVNFVGTNFTVIHGDIHWDSPTEANAYQLDGIQDASGNKVIPIPTDPAALLTTSKITKAMMSDAKNVAVDWTIDSYSPNVTHTIITSDNKTITITTNDYYNSEHAEYKLSHVITSTDTTIIPIGYMVCPLRKSFVRVTDATIVFNSTTSVSYKNVVTRQASVVGESMQVIAGAQNHQNQMVNFNAISVYGNPLPEYYAFYGHLKNGYPTKVYLYPQSSTSNGVTGKTIYAGSRLVLQARY